MSRQLHILIVMTAFALALAGEAAAAGRPVTLEDFLAWRRADQGQISPDGSRIIYRRERVDQMKDGYDGVLWMIDRDGGADRFLLDGHNLRWSPTGDRVAYTARIDGGYQIFVRWMSGEASTTQVTYGALSPGALQWSPDGRQIAFVANAPTAGGDFFVRLPPRPPGAKWNDEPTVIDTLHYRTIDGGFHSGAQQIFVVPAQGGVPRQITHEPLGVGAAFAGIDQGGPIQWTADGRFLVFDGGETKDDSAESRRSRINIVEVASGAVRALTAKAGFWDNPRVSPDGRWIAYEGFSDTASSFAVVELHLMRLDGSDDRILLNDPPDRIYRLFWAPDSRGLYWDANEKGSTNIHYIDLFGHDRTVASDAAALSVSSLSRNGWAVATREDQTSTGDIALIDLRTGRSTPLTDMNADLRREIALPPAEEMWFTAKDGTRIQAWLTKPPGFDPTKHYPLILDIHGGPHEMAGWPLDLRFQLFAAQGYLVFTANPRGSTGYGAAFANAIDNAFPGETDYGDLMTAVDGVVARGFVDPNRLYVMGCSGGGALAAWAVGHTQRFAAAAIMCPVVDWISFAGTSDVTVWGETQFTKPFWQDPAPWLAHSPLMYAGEVTTPTLLIVGDHDFRTPVGQAEAFYRALKLRNIETRLIVVPNESHQPWRGSPSDFMRIQLYLEAWFGAHVKSEKAADGR